MHSDTNSLPQFRIGPGAAFAHGCCGGFRPSSVAPAVLQQGAPEAEQKTRSANDPDIVRTGANSTPFP